MSDTSPHATPAAQEPASAEDRSVATCPKCGHGGVRTTYQPAAPGCNATSCTEHPAQPERFSRRCQGCRYGWETYDVLGSAG